MSECRNPKQLRYILVHLVVISDSLVSRTSAEYLSGYYGKKKDATGYRPSGY